jgi:hypothetical protein
MVAACAKKNKTATSLAGEMSMGGICGVVDKAIST